MAGKHPSGGDIFKEIAGMIAQHEVPEGYVLFKRTERVKGYCLDVTVPACWTDVDRLVLVPAEAYDRMMLQVAEKLLRRGILRLPFSNPAPDQVMGLPVEKWVRESS